MMTERYLYITRLQLLHSKSEASCQESDLHRSEPETAKSWVGLELNTFLGRFASYSELDVTDCTGHVEYSSS